MEIIRRKIPHHFPERKIFDNISGNRFVKPERLVESDKTNEKRKNKKDKKFMLKEFFYHEDNNTPSVRKMEEKRIFC